jgi:hypothetical protein
MITLLSIALLALASCSKEDSSSTTTPETFILPKKITRTRNDGTISNSIITYNGNKIIESYDEIYKYVYTYTGDLITKEAEYEGTVLKSETIHAYENNKLKSDLITSYDINTTTGAIIISKTRKVHTQNSNGTITEEKYTIDNTSGVETKQNGNTTRTFTNGNLVSELRTSSSTFNAGNGNTTITINTNTTTYEYDTKNSFYKNVLGFDKSFYSSSTNNLVKETYKSESTTNGVANPTFPASVINYEYQYNVSGYPIEQKENSTVNSVVQTKITQYFYE